MILDQLTAATSRRLQEEKLTCALSQVQAAAEAMPPSQKQPLTARLNDHFGLIAEVKQASPSKGLIATAFDYDQIAADYTAAGVDAISVLTEPDYFKGDLKDLEAVAAQTPVPVLRKDFIIDSYMIYQAKLAGASLILLIVAILSDQQLRAYSRLAQALGLEVLVECHNEAELTRALAIEPKLIGINNRNLQDFTVDFTTSIRLRQLVPSTIKVIAESGVSQPQQLAALKQAGIDGVLIGETFMKAEDRRALIQRYRAVVA